MPKKQFSPAALEYGLLATVISLAAVTAFDTRQFAVAALCLVGTVICSRRVGQLATARRRARSSGHRWRER